MIDERNSKLLVTFHCLVAEVPKVNIASVHPSLSWKQIVIEHVLVLLLAFFLQDLNKASYQHG